jgi:hypothetical protein
MSEIKFPLVETVCCSAIADAGEFARDASMGVRYPNARVHIINPKRELDIVNRLPG